MHGAMRFLPVGILAGVMAFLLLNLINLRRSRQGGTRIKVIPRAGFMISAVIIFCMTLLSRESGEGAVLDLELFSTWGINDRNNAYVVENVLLFLPYGFFGAWSFRRMRSLFLCAGLGLATSAAVEALQLLTHRGIFQIDDILTNLTGMICGWLIYMAGRGLLFLLKKIAGIFRFSEKEESGRQG